MNISELNKLGNIQSCIGLYRKDLKQVLKDGKVLYVYGIFLRLRLDKHPWHCDYAFKVAGSENFNIVRNILIDDNQAFLNLKHPGFSSLAEFKLYKLKGIPVEFHYAPCLNTNNFKVISL